MFFKVLDFSCIRTNIVETVVPYQQAFVINSYNVFVELYVIPNSHKQKQATFIHLGSENGKLRFDVYCITPSCHTYLSLPVKLIYM